MGKRGQGEGGEEGAGNGNEGLSKKSSKKKEVKILASGGQNAFYYYIIFYDIDFICGGNFTDSL